MEYAHSLAHQLGFLYVAFAHQTDGLFAKEEQEAIWKLLHKWTPTKTTKGQFAQLMDEVMIWYKLKLADQDVLPTVVSLAREMKDFPQFGPEQRQRALADLMRIAQADRHVLAEENEWIQTLAQVWGLATKDIRL